MPSIVKRFLPICLLVTVLAFASRPAPLHAQGIVLPDGFVQNAIAAGFSLPTDFAFAPDGRIFVAEKAGRIRVVQNGSVLGAPLLDISSRVNSMFDRGLLGMTLHP
ncbi:MAG: PQQ-dependent sugar dehydrogenase, partial [Caldilineaceae bacterium]|nr:PQQ-dependent sugar dehydrogenase [Caldilineaceae bacterium]